MADNLLVNGSFEDSTVAPGGAQTFTSLAGWTAIPGGLIDVWNNRIGLTGSQGPKFVELDATGAQDGFYQDVQTSSGQAYTLQLDAKLRPEHPASSMGVQVLWNGVVVSTIAPNAAWTTHSVAVTGTGGLDRLTIREIASQGADGSGALLDNFRLTANAPPGPNNPPDAQNDSATVAQDNVTAIGVRSNDSDPDGDPLTITHINGVAVAAGGFVTMPSGAQVTLNANGTISYNTLNEFDYLGAGESSAETFSYSISDARGGSDTALVSITINGVDDVTTIGAVTPGTVSELADNAPGEGTFVHTISGSFSFADPDLFFNARHHRHWAALHGLCRNLQRDAG